MRASEAEERIRMKAEAALRVAFPDARIIHELVVRQGSCRLDLAAVTEQRLILVEIKSEKDVLTRLEKQAKEARAVADGFKVCVADKHLDKAREITRWTDTCAEADIEREIVHGSYFQRQVMQGLCNAPARLDMLWANELRIVAQSGPKASRSASILRASDSLTGSEVRRRVCAALRAREFPRADAPILSDLFQSPTRALAA